ncbi:hypothetical protein J1N35_024064, partial [Gossypium stocksii]
MSGCRRIKIFGHEESQIQHSLFLVEKVILQLEEVSITGDCVKMISDGQYESDLFCNIKFLRISFYCDVSVVFLISFLRRFYNLKSLELGCCSIKELVSFENDAFEDKDMIITIPKVKILRLYMVNDIRHLWKQDFPLGHICASLECLQGLKCGNLINLGLDLSFSENLTTLDVWKCEKMTELITSLKTQSLACLVTMKIRECERMREVVASDGDETSYEIVFRALKHLELHCLQSLSSFCSRNYTLRFPSLEQVTLSQCPRMKNFNQGELTTPKLQKVQLTETDFRGRWAGDLNATVEQLYQERVGYRGLKCLKLSEFPELVDIWSRNPQEILDFTTLEFLEVCDSNNLRYIFNLSMTFALGKLQQIEIKRCSNLEQVIKEEGPITIVEEAITDGTKIISIFPRLRSIMESCPDMTSFYLGCKGLECPSLIEMKVTNRSNMTTFISTFSGDEEDKEEIIGVEVDNVAFLNLEKIKITHLKNAKRIWHNKLHTNSFSMLKELTVKECNVLLNIISLFLLEVFQRLEKLIVIDCASLEEVFQFQVQGLDIEEMYVIDSQLRELKLIRLPKLKHVWTKYHKRNISFESLRQVCIKECWNLKTLFPFSIAKDLQQLERLIIECCGLEEIVSKNVEGSDEQEFWFAFNQLSFLMLWYLPYLTCFHPGMHRTTWSALKQLRMSGCRRIKIFGHEESQTQPSLFLIEKVIPQLEEVSFTGGCIEMISDGQCESDLFCNIKFLRISFYFDVSIVFLVSFLRRFYNLESLELGSCNFKELPSFENDACEDKDMIITIPKVKKLRFDVVNNIRHLWKQDSPLGRTCASLECLEVWNCGNLINLGLDISFSENLTTLDVFKCNEMLELITSSKVRSLACLVTMRIRECERMREVVASDGDETSYEIVFRALKRLELHCLQSLRSFCSRNYTLRFPSLEQVTLSQCPRMMNFNQGELTTPKLQKVQLTQTDLRGRWAGDLNATVEQLYQEQVGYCGLKRLKLSEFPELVDIWSRNPQEMLDFTTLEFLEVCDSNNLRYIINLSMAFGLRQLRQMKFKRCNNLEQVIKEEGPITIVEEAIIDSSNIISIFRRLRSIIVESCPDMTSFYMESKGLECLSLVEIKIANCSNMTTFVSTFSSDEDKEMIIGEEVDNVATIFSDK